MSNRPGRFHERLVITLPPQQKAEVIVLADRENLSVAAVVRRALSRELAGA